MDVKKSDLYNIDIVYVVLRDPVSGKLLWVEKWYWQMIDYLTEHGWVEMVTVDV